MQINPDITLEQVQLAEATLDKVRQQAATRGWNQRTWVGTNDDGDLFYRLNPGSVLEVDDFLEDTNLCGSSGCFAGWALALAGNVVVGNGGYRADAYSIAGRLGDEVMLGERLGPVDAVAPEALGVDALTDDDADHLFAPDNTIEDLERHVASMRAVYEARADLLSTASE